MADKASFSAQNKPHSVKQPQNGNLISTEQEASLRHMFKLAAPIDTLIGLLILVLFLRKYISINTDRKAQIWWRMLGALFGVSCPVIVFIVWLRYPY